jgi:hypothetical protein
MSIYRACEDDLTVGQWHGLKRLTMEHVAG